MFCAACIRRAFSRTFLTASNAIAASRWRFRNSLSTKPDAALSSGSIRKARRTGILRCFKSIEGKQSGLTQTEAFEAIGFKKDARDFTRAAEILNELGVKSIRMLTNNPDKTGTLERHGVKVVGTKEIVIDAGENKELRTYLEGKIKEGHSLKLD